MQVEVNVTCMQANLVSVPFSVSEILLLLSFDQISLSNHGRQKIESFGIG